jgi:hypothetical protein
VNDWSLSNSIKPSPSWKANSCSATQGIRSVVYSPMFHYRPTSIYELSRNEQFVFTNIARTNKLRLPIHLASTEPRAYKRFYNLTSKNLTISVMKNVNTSYEHSTYTFQRTHYIRDFGFVCPMFTGVSYWWSLSWPGRIQSLLHHPISLRSTLILSFNPLLGLPSGLFPSSFPTKNDWSITYLTRSFELYNVDCDKWYHDT